MVEVFLKLVNMSIAAGWLVAAVVLLRVVLRRAPKNIYCILWLFVALRLICPFSFESALSLIPSAETVPQHGVLRKGAEINTGMPAIDVPVNDYFERQELTDVPDAAGKEYLSIGRICCALWLAGMFVMTLSALVNYVRIKRRVRENIRLTGNVFLCDRIQTPFILGVLHPNIYLPSDIKEEQAQYVVAHEQAHIKRRDYIWKPFGYCLLILHWMNPLIWAAYHLFCNDIELACDERVIKDFDRKDKKCYSSALLEFGILHQGAAAGPLAFGKVSIRARVKAVLNYKKPAFWTIFPAVIVCGAVAVCFLTDPKPVEAVAGEDLQEPQEAVAEAEEDLQEPQVLNDEELYDKLYAVADLWAKAFVERDGERIAAMASEEVRESLEEAELLSGYSFGYSSPWPWYAGDGEENQAYLVYVEPENSGAVIKYYAMTSDPHLTVWMETLNIDADTGLIIGETLHYYDNIASEQEFAEAYTSIDGTPMDYMQNGLGESLNENALLDSGKLYRDLFDPLTAASDLLNLLDNENKVKLRLLSDDLSGGTVEIEITFLEDGGKVRLLMVQPYGYGIWVPQEDRREWEQ